MLRRNLAPRHLPRSTLHALRSSVFEVNMKKFFLLAIGLTLVILGIALVLKEWAAVMIVFKGVIGAILAIAGLVVLCMLNE
jgi:hypothetical protein